MENIYITDIAIKNGRHLKNIRIPLSAEKRKHLTFTGEKGSETTSVLEVNRF